MVLSNFKGRILWLFRVKGVVSLIITIMIIFDEGNQPTREVFSRALDMVRNCVNKYARKVLIEVVVKGMTYVFALCI